MQKRPTAVVVIYSASILHIVEAFILAESKAADTSIPIASLLDAFGGHRITLVATMLVSALLALTVAGQRPGVLAIFALAESARGISPRAAHRSGLDTLASSGSCHRVKAAAFR